MALRLLFAVMARLYQSMLLSTFLTGFSMYTMIRSWLQWHVRQSMHSSQSPRQMLRRYRPSLENLECRLTPAAYSQGTQFLISESLSAAENPPAVAIIDAGTGAGDFISVWQSYGQDGDGFGIFAQFFDKDGKAIAGQPAFQVNQPLSLLSSDPALGNQMSATVASDGAGHFVVAWQSENQSTGNYDVFYRQGSFVGGTLSLQDQVQVNTLFVSGNQLSPSAAMDAAGGFVIAWQSQDALHPELGYDIYAKQGTVATGLTTADEFLINNDYTSGDQTSPAASINMATGDFVVAWRGPDPGSSGSEGEEVPGILFNVFYTDGSTLEDSGEVLANATTYHDLGVPDIAINTLGTIVVAWQVEGQPESGSDIFGRRFSFNSSGTPQVNPLSTGSTGINDFQLNTVMQGPQRAPSVGIDNSDNFFAVWQTQHQDGFSWAIFGKRYDAGTNSFGAEELVNKGTQMGPQINPDVAMTGNGRTVVVWQGPDVPTGADEGEGGHKPGIHAHIYEGAGATTVGTGEVLLAIYAGLEDSPSAIASDAAGNFVVVWQSWEDTGDNSDFGIYAKLYQLNGQPIDINGNGLDDDRLLVNTTTIGSQNNPSVAMDAAGNFVVVWQSALEDGSGTGIYARRYNASQKNWAPEGAFLVNTTTAGNQSLPKIAMDAVGNFAIVWQSTDGVNSSNGSTSTGIFGRCYSANGVALGTVFQINTVSDYNQFSPVIAMNATGQFVVGWVSDHGVTINAADTEKSIFARWYNASGVPLGSTEMLVNVYTKDAQEHPSVGIDSKGNFVFTWQSINQEMNVDGEGNSWGVYARQFVVNTATGTITSPQTKEFRVNETTDGPQRFPSIGVDQAGNYVVSWQSIRQDASSWAILSRQYKANGQAEGPEAMVNSYGSGPQILPVVAGRGTGDYVIIWNGQAPGHLEGISAQRYHFVRDTFNRGNFPSLGPDWTVRVGNYDIHDNVASVQSSLGLATLNKVTLADVSVEGYVTLGGGLTQVQGLIARYAGSGDRNMYFGRLIGMEGDFKAEIWRNVNGTWTRLSSKAVDQGEGLLRFEVVGTSLKLFMNDQLATYAFDSAITKPGLIGMRGWFDSALDNFSYSAITKVTAALPFRDTFNLTTGSQLNRFWKETAGNFTVINNRLTGSDSINLAALNATASANVFAESMVDVSAGGSAGVVARYSGVGDRNMYWGSLANRSGVLTAEIWRNYNGTWTRLVSKPVTSSTGLVRFEVVGSSLKLFLNSSLVASATDTVLRSPGIKGIRGTANVSHDDFSTGLL